MNKAILSAEGLNQILNTENLIILDCTLKNQLLKQPIEIQDIQIKNARFFDLKFKFSDLTNEFPTAYPSKSQFETEAQALGINTNSTIVVYDANGIYSSPRVWWLFKSMGHQDVYVLDGGLPEWISKGFPTETKTESNYPKGNFKANLNPEIVRRFDDVFNNLTTKKELVVDVRSADRFNGVVKEPREGLRSGQIDNSINIPYTKVLNNGKFESEAKLIELFKSLEQEDKPLVFSCGSGITACVMYLASEGILKNKKAVYDGSWTEWGDKVKAD
ncbi:thiosulfate sulfurtransferase, rhodanese [Formosa agariphila KMM 3901]|uniref:Thiosulfate sulfurtransferase, rhodanese n=1 Tax=Formosa agariphila (strain DSM 15362 / KCTC 12365 / LMG 23005 / KMM 3901 / M-2Alg 35-1) TaxID=1347342 RepID=T2KKW8_FORAG|nr:sulfurtransferase [Formosa agariphila]CDF79081.1 thiosulfate sulfurtransferase, rhodanese [Formosa agariphila KMM 3901]